jgi:hypothetical protein
MQRYVNSTKKNDTFLINNNTLRFLLSLFVFLRGRKMNQKETNLELGIWNVEFAIGCPSGNVELFNLELFLVCWFAPSLWRGMGEAHNFQLLNELASLIQHFVSRCSTKG